MLESLKKLLEKDTMKVIGLISGTSCDGVDAALCELSGHGVGNLKVKVIAYHSEPYSDALKKKILDISNPKAGHTDELCRLNFRIGDSFSRAAENIIERAGLPREAIDLIGSHGQTVAHLPPRTEIGPGSTGHVQRHGSTLQLGEPAMIAERMNVPVISNFRARDMAAGGQGAPLVPYVDYLYFTHPERTRAVINIGGISNMTYIPKGAKIESVLAFDSGPGNMIIDALIQRITQNKVHYDKNGEAASKGQVDGYILNELLKHPYLKLEPPKSTGREEFGATYANQVFEWGIGRSVKPSDILRTATDFTAITLADAYKKYLLAKGPVDEIIISGGGAMNGTLMARMKREFGAAPIALSDDYGMPIKAKEAIAFAILARETILGNPGNLPSVTGASGLRILGQITPP
ncbi:MAG: anhydro-N-acetylmuramic acid kinase [Planctomycetota bacterium]|nr:anhydro-N-acetylmuramic acid kinase [Planctomycetota bacterium]